MQINFKQLVDYIASTDDKEEIRKAIKAYCAVRVQQNIEKAWENAHRWYGKLMRLRTERLKKENINYNEYTGSIEIPHFILFCSKIEEAIYNSIKKHPDSSFALEDVHETMTSAIGNIKMDKRSIIPFRDEED